MGNTCLRGHSKSETQTLPKVDPQPFDTPHDSRDFDKIDPHGRCEKPLPPVPAKKRVRALYNFQAITDGDLSFKKGDLMEIESADPENENWWQAIHLKTKKRGYIPSNYVAKDESPLKAHDWWFEIDRKESDKVLLLAGNPQGTFLVREAGDKKSYVLSVRGSDKTNGEVCVKHYRICKMDDDQGYYISAKKTFPSLVDLISHYRDSSNELCCRLTKACPRSRPVVQFRELEISRENVRLSTKLGAGCFGDVWKGTLCKVVDVAVKTLRPGTMSSADFLEEAKTMHRLRHPKLVLLLAVVSIDEPFYIITELMVNGSLLDFLRSAQGKSLTFNMLIGMNSQIADGMAYLESVNFIHRDLRAANILVGEHFDVKVADFGLARILDSEDRIYPGNEKSKFPIKWTAPEAANNRKFGVKSDVWSFGVLMYEIITFGRVPYSGMSGHEVIHMLDRGYRMEKPVNGPLAVPDAYYDMMLKCWDRVPEQRPTFESLHDFFDGYFINIEPNYREMDDM